MKIATLAAVALLAIYVAAAFQPRPECRGATLSDVKSNSEVPVRHCE